MIQRICKYPGCPKTADESGYCKNHQQLGIQLEKNRNKVENIRMRVERLRQKDAICKRFKNTQRWKKLKKTILERYPVCYKCGATENLEVHHIIPHRGSPDLFFDKDNLVVLCRSCHLNETMRLLREAQLSKLKDLSRGGGDG